MNHMFTPQEQQRIAEARESFSGRLLTNTQFDTAVDITGILEREIKRSGSFTEQLGKYSVALARSDRVEDVMKSEQTLRSLFKARTGQTMNQMRETLEHNAENLTNEQRQHTLTYAQNVGQMIKEGQFMAFNRAYAHQGEQCAMEFGITEFAAKKLMSEQFEKAENKKLYDWGKALEKTYFQPQVDKTIKDAEVKKEKTRTLSRQFQPS